MSTPPLGLAKKLRHLRRGLFVSPRAQVVRTEVLGETVFFTVINPRDEIQRHHLQGAFYEPEELAIIARHFPLGGRFCDIGTNVGNHTVYVAKFLRARRIVCLEPNPAAIEVLLSNLALNRVEGVVDLRFLGIGLSDSATETAGVTDLRHNLGAARLTEGAGDIPLARFDDLLSGEAFDLIKIDVEGMEMRVLAGMEKTLAETRPALFIEVDQANAAAFAAWLETSGYREVERFQRYPENTNHLVVPA